MSVDTFHKALNLFDAVSDHVKDIINHDSTPSSTINTPCSVNNEYSITYKSVTTACQSNDWTTIAGMIVQSYEQVDHETVGIAEQVLSAMNENGVPLSYVAVLVLSTMNSTESMDIDSWQHTIAKLDTFLFHSTTRNDAKYTLIQYIGVAMEHIFLEEEEIRKIYDMVCHDQKNHKDTCQFLVMMKYIRQHKNTISHIPNSNPNVTHYATQTATSIHNTANYIANTLSKCSTNLTLYLDTLKPPKQPHPHPPTNSNHTSPIVAKAYAESATRATDLFRQTIQTAVFGLRDVSSYGLTQVAEQWDHHNLSQELLPDDHLRNVASAAGTVAIASIGAFQIVAESVLESTKIVAQKSVSVTAEVSSQKYGETVGTIVQNVGDTTGNVMRAMTSVAMLEGSALTKAVVKHTAKVHVEEEIASSSVDNR